ncbi:50S ribosomal protein L4 [candidate division WOR-1 bacterium RIFOXYA2_FULL_36_21]|uniref:Large ribosomal subunit protein uL4 n=1 Tax=candidate division WOR-1 bacterium RIFOXYB2_FULL_36_35 TaxID=1802578 RepID=A0A1F4S523_UNCSA|nr:MAG: 50S ribosomal protein L4 [candidate division WOR-1 bacterium RIFOXYA2_FULL_36_21]OGC15531.1 MAG: 50S ribosomal protein L4 [candidate division WOR-1 bacterium RIFOXYB2_FULL_36_35]OGC21316.1 MAG: 50S ribosomal protein L4 [candidate division WOR-1 bacterium RIFOXYA12_FULL_36_13]
MKLKIFDLKGKSLGDMEADSNLFGVKENVEVVHSTLRWLLNSKRSGTHSTLTRAEVRGGGVKPWKQKGTGRARAGSIRSPLWRHGGVIFGPKPRDYSFHLPRKIRKLALRVVLSDKARGDKLKIVKDFNIDQPKTKLVKDILDSFNLSEKKVVVVVDKISKELSLGSRNLRNIKVLSCENLNVFDLLNADILLMTESAVNKLREMF